MKRFVLLAIAVCLLALVAFPATAAPVQVTLRVAQGNYYTAATVCPVSIEEASDGIAVLEAARTSGCIQSYTLEYYSFGAFVSCINGVCGDPAPTYLRYWSMREGVPGSPIPGRCDVTSYGVSDYRAAAGEELSFTFETAATGLAPAACISS